MSEDIAREKYPSFSPPENSPEKRKMLCFEECVLTVPYLFFLKKTEKSMGNSISIAWPCSIIWS